MNDTRASQVLELKIWFDQDTADWPENWNLSHLLDTEVEVINSWPVVDPLSFEAWRAEVVNRNTYLGYHDWRRAVINGDDTMEASTETAS